MRGFRLTSFQVGISQGYGSSLPMKILILDDDSLIHDAFRLILSDHELFSATCFEAAVAILGQQNMDLVLADVHLGEDNRTGPAFLKYMKPLYPHIPVVMISGDDSVDQVVECMRLGADDYVEKPATPELLEKVKDVVRKYQKTHSSSSVRLTEILNRDDVLIGNSPQVLQAKSKISQAKKMRILLIGETGVGKTPFAYYSNLCLREKSQTRPFEQINCASLNRERFQDELFGHKRGAFTNAFSDKKGLVELAEGGDLFLDEIGEMPLDVQALFLTFLDSMEYYRMGEDFKRKAQVRIICATNRDLKDMVEKGLFRKDLFSRIAQIIVHIPPLRERKDDIPLLFKHFSKQFLGFEKECDPKVLEALKNYSWTDGNVREFRDAVEYICVMSAEANRIKIDHLPDHLSSSGIALPAPKGLTTAHLTSQVNSRAGSQLDKVYQTGLESYLDEFERNILVELYSHHRGNVNEIADLIRLSRPTLYRRLKKYNLLQSVPDVLNQSFLTSTSA